MNKSLLGVLVLAGALWSTAAEMPVKNGDKIAFLGDSITAGGMNHSNGYCRLVIRGLAANGITAEPIGAGISGHKSNQMLARLDKDGTGGRGLTTGSSRAPMSYRCETAISGL